MTTTRQAGQAPDNATAAANLGLATSVLAREELRAILSDMTRLPDDQRAALALMELGDLRHAEIARLHGCRAEKVKALVHQARAALAVDRHAARRHVPRSASSSPPSAAGHCGVRRCAVTCAPAPAAAHSETRFTAAAPALACS